MGERAESTCAGGLLAWPGWPHLRYASVLSLANGAWFILVFGGCDLLTARRILRVPIHFTEELEIPFIPAMTVVYMSIYSLFLAGPFILRTQREFRAVIISQFVIISIAGVGFVFFPAQLAFPPLQEGDLGSWKIIFLLADQLNLTYNLLPSLHVALTVSCVIAFSSHTTRIGKALLWTWATGVAISTLLIHQHHILDVLTGWFLASVCMKLIYKRLLYRDTLLK